MDTSDTAQIYFFQIKKPTYEVTKKNDPNVAYLERIPDVPPCVKWLNSWANPPEPEELLPVSERSSPDTTRARADTIIDISRSGFRSPGYLVLRSSCRSGCSGSSKNPDPRLSSLPPFASLEFATFSRHM